MKRAPAFIFAVILVLVGLTSCSDGSSSDDATVTNDGSRERSTTSTTLSSEDFLSEVDAAGLRHGYSDLALTQFATDLCDAAAADSSGDTGDRPPNTHASSVIANMAIGTDVNPFPMEASEASELASIVEGGYCPQYAQEISHGADVSESNQ